MNEQQERALLQRFRPYAYALAYQFLPEDGSFSVDDLAQEAWIAIWRELPNDRSAEYLKQAARNRLKMVIRDSRAKKRDARQTSLIGLSSELDLYTSLTTELGDIEVAYHHGQLAAALDTLSPKEREYVWLRFWRGYRFPDLMEHFGYNPSDIWRRSQTKLRKALVHLDA